MRSDNNKLTINIIIVTFNSEKYISKCISELAKSCGDYVVPNITVVDNNSSDNTIAVVKGTKIENGRISILKNKFNLGFAKAVNQGINNQRGCDYFLFANPDTIVKKDTIRKILRSQKDNGAGIVGVKMVNPSGKPSGSYFRFPNLMVGLFDMTNLRKLDFKDKWHKYFYYSDYKNRKKDFPVDVVTGGFMLSTKKTVETLGGLDERYFMYLEDVDYCKRAKQSGISRYLCDTEIIHIGGASSKNKNRIRHSSWIMSRKIYFLRNFNILENMLIQTVFLLDDLLIAALSIL